MHNLIDEIGRKLGSPQKSSSLSKKKNPLGSWRVKGWGGEMVCSPLKNRVNHPLPPLGKIRGESFPGIDGKKSNDVVASKRIYKKSIIS